MVEILLRHQASPNKQNYLFRRTPLHYAANEGHADCVRMLLQFNADPRIPDRDGKTALEIANGDAGEAINGFEVRMSEEWLSPIIECSEEELASYVSPDMNANLDYKRDIQKLSDRYEFYDIAETSNIHLFGNPSKAEFSTL